MGTLSLRGSHLGQASAGDDMRFEGRSAPSRYHPPLAERLLELAALRPGMAVLDVACGTGLVLLDAAAAVGPSGRVAGVDLSAQMLKQVSPAFPRVGSWRCGSDRLPAAPVYP